MKFDKNRKYKTKGGLDFIFSKTIEHDVYDFEGFILYPDGSEERAYYTEDGKFFNYKDSLRDLVEVEQGIDLSEIKTLVNGNEVRKLHIVEDEIWGEYISFVRWKFNKWDLEGKDLDGMEDFDLKVGVEER